MAASKDDLAKALEAMTSGQTDAHPEEQQPQEPPVAPRRPERPADPTHVSHTIRPLPGKPGTPAVETHLKPIPDRNIGLRRTMIPPLLTLGTLMPLAGVASLVMGEESPLGEQLLVPVLLILLGLLILGVAALNMLQVRHLLSASAKR